MLLRLLLRRNWEIGAYLHLLMWQASQAREAVCWKVYLLKMLN